MVYPSGLRLREAREAAGLSRPAIAAAVSRCEASVARWEKGEHRPPEGVLVQIAHVLGVSLSQLR